MGRTIAMKPRGLSKASAAMAAVPLGGKTNGAGRKPATIDAGLPDDPAILAQQIRRISAGVEALTRNGLNHRAVVVLLAHSSKVPRKVVEAVLASLGTLAQDYCK